MLMHNIGIGNWKDIEAKYKNGAILLGNGASIAVCPNFKYDTLFRYACNKNLISDRVRKVFKEYHSTNFEYILGRLWDADRINRYLDPDSDRTLIAYDEVREALIKTIKDLHDFGKIRRHLKKIASFLDNFRTVINLNYDLIAYWAIMFDCKTRAQFGDCFKSGTFESGNIKDPKKEKFIYYPHGSLILAAERSGSDIKIATGGSNNLLDAIAKKWEESDIKPLFISEGNSQNKMNSIHQSPYLSSIYEKVLKTMELTLVIYGWSGANQDKHIFDAFAESPLLVQIAISVLNDGKNLERAQELARRLKALPSNPSIEYFDAKSPGCWIHTDS